MKPERAALGARVRQIRRRERLTQVQLAQRLGISPSYLNLIEHNRRSLSAPLLIKLSQVLNVELKMFSAEEDARSVAELLEVFGDPLFEGHDLTAPEIQELATANPPAARAILALYHAYRSARESADTLAMRLSEEDPASVDSRLPSEEVSDLIQRHGNYFPELEEGAEGVWRVAGLGSDDLYSGLVRHLDEDQSVEVKIAKAGEMEGALRRYEPGLRRLTLSEVLRRGSRNFQLAYQLGLLTQGRSLDQLAADPRLTTPESRALARVALANYFAAAVLMPYQAFAAAARTERYDVDLLGHRFRTSFEQVCHRLTTLRRPGSEGIPFHFLRIDIAGNISKRFSASGVRFARFSGACPRWNVFAAFLTPGRIRIQLSRMPDATAYFSIARTRRKESGGYHAPQTHQALELGCEVRYARDLVYAEGMDLQNLAAAVPVGVTCRLCERMDCEQRAFPPMQHPLQVQENVRGISFYAPVAPR